MININILPQIRYYPVWVNNRYEARIDPVTFKITWEPSLFSMIEGEFTELEVKDIEEKILKQFKLILENEY